MTLMPMLTKTQVEEGGSEEDRFPTFLRYAKRVPSGRGMLLPSMPQSGTQPSWVWKKVIDCNSAQVR